MNRLILFLVITICLSDSPVIGQGSPAFFMGNGRSGEKPQSKVWFYDGAWWCILPGTVSKKTTQRIYRFRVDHWEIVDSRQDPVDERAGARADVLCVDDALYVLSFHPRQTRFIAYDYDKDYKRYVKRKGFPVALAPLPLTGVETMVLAYEEGRRFWAIFEGELPGQKRGEIRAIWSEDREGLKWNTEGVRLGMGVDPDDIATVCRFVIGKESHLAVIWSHQSAQKSTHRDSAGVNRLWMRIHRDGDDPQTWSPSELVASGAALADDHLNTAVGRDGTIYLVTKTSLDDLKPVDRNLPLLMLYKRPPDGIWEGYPVSPILEAGTRPIVVLDDALGVLHVFYSRPSPHSRDERVIIRRQSDKDRIYFNQPEIAIAFGGIYLNDVTSTRQRVSSHTGLMVMCWGQDRKKRGPNRAYYMLDPLGGD